MVMKDLGAILAIGGGSTIDTAKGASLLATHGGKVNDYAGWGKAAGSSAASGGHSDHGRQWQRSHLLGGDHRHRARMPRWRSVTTIWLR